MKMLRLGDKTLKQILSEVQEIRASKDENLKKQRTNIMITNAQQTPQLQPVFAALSLLYKVTENVAFDDFKQVYNAFHNYAAIMEHEIQIEHSRKVNHSLFDDFSEPATPVIPNINLNPEEIQKTYFETVENLVCEATGIESIQEKTSTYIR
jgi:predicted signal transduction protein with EAL and GGDEF domain